ncbi:MAG: hypothetical protein K8U03_09840 [Planctomycetia bacterium]|nr:hypothetical protein [Planctomycetia bacterium]
MTPFFRRRRTLLALLTLLGGAASCFSCSTAGELSAFKNYERDAQRNDGKQSPKQPVAKQPVVAAAPRRASTGKTSYLPQNIPRPNTTRSTSAPVAPLPGAQAPQLLEAPPELPRATIVPLDSIVSDAAAQPIAPLVAMQQPPEPQQTEPQRNAAPPIIVPPQASELVPPPAGTEELAPFVPPPLTGIGAATTSIALPKGEMPRNFAKLTHGNETQLLAPPDQAPQVSAPFYSTPRAPDFTYRPLYFEERGLERNGRTIGLLQPGLSAAHFFGTIPILPYKMGAQPPSRPMYTGNGVNVPSDRLTWRDRVRGVMAEALVVLGFNYAMP